MGGMVGGSYRGYGRLGCRYVRNGVYNGVQDPAQT